MLHAQATNRKNKNDDGTTAPSSGAESPDKSLGGAMNALVKALTPKPVALPKQGHAMEEAHGLPTDTRSPARLGFRVLAIGFGGFLLWAAFAPLNEGVPTSGIVTIETKRKAVQHLTGGIVKAVHVKEGQIVHEGAPLMEIDPASTQAVFENARQRYYTLRAMEARLLAEQGGREAISFHPDLLSEKDSPLVADLIANQQGLFEARQMAFQAEIQAIEESISGLEGIIKGYQGLMEAKRLQLTSIKEEIKGVEELVKDGYAPKNNLLALQRTQAEIMGNIADLQGNIERAKSSMAEAKLRITQKKQEFRKGVDQELAEVRGQVDGEAERFNAIRADLARADDRARRPAVRSWDSRYRPWVASSGRGRRSWTSCPRTNPCCWRPTYRRISSTAFNLDSERTCGFPPLHTLPCWSCPAGSYRFPTTCSPTSRAASLITWRA